MQLELQKFLRDGNRPEDVKEKYAVKHSIHDVFPNLVLFKYNQLNSPLGDPLVKECRGIILDSDNDWEVVSYPYNKFFNYGEGNADTIDWETAEVQEKLDGSIVTLYWYDEDWRVASSGMAGASGLVDESNITFKDLFWKVWKEMGYKEPLDANLCYMFELMTSYNRVVVVHPKNRLVLHGARNVNTFEEYRAEDIGKENDWEFVQSFPLGNIKDVIASCDKIDPIKGEGYVVVDANFHRIKVKSPQYVAMAHSKDTMSVKNMLVIIMKNETAEFLNYFPDFKALYEKIEKTVEQFEIDEMKDYETIKHIEDQKEFALVAREKEHPSVMFALKKGRTPKDHLQYVMEMSGLDKLMKLLKLERRIEVNNE